MAVLERIQQDVTVALKAGDRERTGALRLIANELQKAIKEARDQAAVDSRLEELRQACAGDANLLEPMRAALKERASIGEVCGVMREEFGEYSEA